METQTQHREAPEIAVATLFQDTSLPEPATFRKEGEYWTIGCGRHTFRLRDSRGLGYLAHLLRHPGTKFHVLELAGEIAGQHDADETSRSGYLPRGRENLEQQGIHITRLGDAGEMLDQQAKVAYRRALSDLREELKEAKELGKVERAEKAEREIDALVRELSRAVGLGGRNRRAASAAERARQSITKAMKAVMERIAQSDSQLGEIFSRCIKTGCFCSYQPDPDFPIAWELAATDSGSTSDLSEQPASSAVSASPASPAVVSVSPFALAERTTFVGRETECDAIRAAIDRALTGRGSVVMLEGGPGAGKTRLAMQMAEYASSVGFRCLVGHCYERDEEFPYLPFAEIIESSLAQASNPDEFRLQMGENAAELAQIAPSLRRIFPDIAAPLDLPAQQRRRFLFQSVSEQTARVAQVQPRLYILEDLQWADESTLAFFIHLANRVSQFPLVIIATYRDEHSEKSPALARTLEELIRLSIRPLKLAGLSNHAVAQMVNALSRRRAPEHLVNAIFEESQGCPFFVEEVYRHLIEEGRVFDAAGQFRDDIEIDESDVPENVRLIIGRRLQRLDANEMRVLAAAAVIGRSFSFRLLSAVCDIDVDELFAVVEKAQHMGIIVTGPEGPETPFSFDHELVRQTVLGTMLIPRRQQLHARVADAIELLYPEAVDERAGEVAGHLLKAKSFADSQRVIRRSLTQAGKNALDAAGSVAKPARILAFSNSPFPQAIFGNDKNLYLVGHGAEGRSAGL